MLKAGAAQNPRKARFSLRRRYQMDTIRVGRRIKKALYDDVNPFRFLIETMSEQRIETEGWNQKKQTTVTTTTTLTSSICSDSN